MTAPHQQIEAKKTTTAAGSAWYERVLRPAVLLRLTFALTIVIYARTITFDWVFDDHIQVVLNPWLSSWSSLKQMFTLHSWAFSDYGFAGTYYRPLYLVWLLINNKLFGGTPGWFHLAGIFLHVGAVWLAFLTARRLLKDDRTAAIAALLFALHPGKVESVAWVAGLTEPLLAVFFFGSVLGYLRWQQSQAREGKWLVVSVTCFAAALLSKETAVFAPLLLLMHFGMSERPKPPFVRVARLALPYAIVAIAYFGIRAIVMTGTNLGANLSIAKTLYTLPEAFLWYVQHTVWPFGLSLFYPEMIVRSAGARFVVPLVIDLALLIGLVWLMRKSVTGTVMGLWFFLMLLPPLGAVLMVQPHDRYLYIPSFGAAVIAAGIIGKLPARWAAMVVAVIAIAFAVGSYRTTSYWEDDLHVFGRSMEVAPDNPDARSAFAGSLMEAGQKDRALAVLQEGFRRRPDSAKLVLMLAQTYQSNGDWQNARRYYEEMVALSGDSRLMAMGHYGLGSLEEEQGNLQLAEEQYRRAISTASTAAGYHQRLGFLLQREGRLEEAKAEFAKEQEIRRQRTRNF
ncbi:MAG TPA: tetratricopeptide repeat protein [Terriglobales bacterium]